jgi:hypothetical protein
MRFFPCRIEHPLNMPVQRPHHSYPREHRWAAMLCNKKQGPHGGLPFGGIVFSFRQLGDLERDALADWDTLYLREAVNTDHGHCGVV